MKKSLQNSSLQQNSRTIAALKNKWGKKVTTNTEFLKQQHKPFMKRFTKTLS